MSRTTTATSVNPLRQSGRSQSSISRWTRLRNSEHLVGYLFVAPLLVGLLVFTYGPVLAAFVLSFTKGDYISTPKFIGLGNYQALLQEDLFWISMRNTLYYVVGVVPAGLLLSLLLALTVTPLMAEMFAGAHDDSHEDSGWLARVRGWYEGKV